MTTLEEKVDSLEAQKFMTRRHEEDDCGYFVYLRKVVKETNEDAA